MRVFVTVGSTKFDALVNTVLTRLVLDAFHAKGYTDVVIQCGNSHVSELGDTDSCELNIANVSISVWRFKPSLELDVAAANLVISHAGSGTILDVLREGKPLMVVPNETLLDNHQRELADALSNLGHLRSCSVGNLAKALLDFDPKTLTPFPAFDGSRFREIIDQEMGYSD